MSKSQLERAVLSDPGILMHGLRAPRSRRWGDRQTRSGRARVPLAQRAEADGWHAALRPATSTPPPATCPSITSATPSRSRRSTASRSPVTRAPARSPTRRSARCSPCTASSCPVRSSASCSTATPRARSPAQTTATYIEVIFSPSASKGTTAPIAARRQGHDRALRRLGADRCPRPSSRAAN